jgi:hypothetical protein
MVLRLLYSLDLAPFTLGMGVVSTVMSSILFAGRL